MKTNMAKKQSELEPFPPSLWERVILILQKNGQKSEFASRVEDIRQGAFILEMPIRQCGELSLSKGDSVEVTYSKAESNYTFKASILDLFDEDGAVSIKKVSAATRLQRRKFIRIGLSGKMTFRPLDEFSGKESGFGPETVGVLLNISAGGLLFESQRKLKTNSLILLNFSLKSKHQLKDVLAVVKRCEGCGGKGYLVGAEFMTRSRHQAQYTKKFDDLLPSGTGTFDENLQKLVLQFIYDNQIRRSELA